MKKEGLVIGLFLLSYTIFITATFTQEVDYRETDYWAFAGFTILYILLGLFPIQLKRTNITFASALSLAVFLLYGFYVEAWLLQVSVIITLLSLRVRNIPRYLINMMMFLSISYFSALVYTLLDYQHEYLDSLSNLPFLAIIGYILAQFIFNEILLSIARGVLYGDWRFTTLSDTLWDITTTLLIAPLGLLLYYFYQKIGGYTMIYFGVPMLAISFLLRFYNEIKKVNDRLNDLNAYTSHISAKLHVEESIQEVFAAVQELFPCAYQYILYRDEQKDFLYPLGIRGELNEQQITDFMQRSFPLGEGVNGRSAFIQEIVSSSSDAGQASEYPLRSENQFLLSVPMIRNQQCLGVITLVFQEKMNLTKNDAYLLQVLANQAGITLYNAHQYELSQRRMLRDELTGMYNYRAFDNQMFRMFHNCKKNDQPLSLIVMDIDHFKEVNDTYGHLAGNEVLKQVAICLERFFREHGTVFRYGGEEFTILLPGVSVEDAYAYAESIRATIERLEIPVENSLGVNEQVILRVTVSIGIATYPQQAEDPVSLLRNADRAMYVGAKQKGRNKVAIYG